MLCDICIEGHNIQFMIYAYIIFAIVRLPELDKEAQIAEDEAQKVISSILKENYTELIDCFQEQIKQYQKERDSRVDFACYNDLPLELYQSIILLDGTLVDLYKRKAEFSKSLSPFINTSPSVTID
ncbi:hypothetical protein Smp_029400 [Schistosoma mansoni]|uniref:hypothetical protein n=1 Tax=Schistosoma mansoni TaxID=6183 RepID=UPI0001A63A37|nr:hypothetical protein Smp_029400 [Schistosoma mansoni]|eukprot:XP_018645553.1 hypothetical protein Smp_029400 [Schistosoma mansoni]